jgi:hypothetical protein
LTPDFQALLFPVLRKGMPAPYKDVLRAYLPGALKSILIVDPSPPSEIISACEKAAPNVTCRILLKLDSSTAWNDFLNALSDQQILDLMAKKNCSIRWYSELSAKVYIVDDAAIIISGTKDDDRPYGLAISGTDAIPVLEYWEEKWKGASKLTPEKLQNQRAAIMENILKGHVAKDQLIGYLNHHGAIVDIHVKLFRGFNKMVLRPFAKDESIKQDLPILWNLIETPHYRAFQKHATRLHSLKSRAYLIETPAGPFLPNELRLKWETDFNVRLLEFNEAVKKHLAQHYSDIRSGAFESLDWNLEAVFDQAAALSPELPWAEKSTFLEELGREYRKLFPTEQKLVESCKAWFIRLSLHPDSVDAQMLARMISQVSAHAELI